MRTDKAAVAAETSLLAPPSLAEQKGAEHTKKMISLGKKLRAHEDSRRSTVATTKCGNRGGGTRRARRDPSPAEDGPLRRGGGGCRGEHRVGLGSVR